MTANPLPEAVSRRGLTTMEKAACTLLLSGLFFGLEVLTGSSYAFSALVALYVALTAATVAVAGGVATLFGIVVLFFSFQHVVASQLMKFALGERSDARLSVPVITMLAENLSLVGIAAGLLFVRAIRPRPTGLLFPPIRDIVTLRRVALVGTGLAIVRQAAVLLSGAGATEAAGTAVGPLKQLGMIDLVAFGAAVGVAVLESDGRRMTNRFTWILLAPQILLGAVSGARLGIAIPVVAMVGSALAFGFRPRLKHFAIATALGYLFFFVISPFGLAMRGLARGRSLGIVENVQVGFNVLSDVIADPGKYQGISTTQLETIPPEKYNTLYFLRKPDNTSNLMERFSMVKFDDLVIESTLREGMTGWGTILPGFGGFLPSSFGFEKSFRPLGNMIAHRIHGYIQENDFETFITTGTVSDAFGAFGWIGVFLAHFVLVSGVAYVYGRITDLRLTGNIFALALVVNMTWPFSEESIGGVMAMPLYRAVLTTLAFFITTRSASLVDFRYLRPREVRDEGA